ncbi:expressed unknown protein [Seminavis robusta]|uniref:Uncharacterized protein n=1 Tax=Seminavis robusta TaxID=568900 RepID=A0A9N8EHE5_9STRA|nr:expressed unknown protein [Seminavis robusta]|eukprot:Sro1171_g248810.1 n/a (262) ;mRNA; r:5930-6715
MPFHKEYADGSPRPLCRGWLHGMGALTTLPAVYRYWDDIPTTAIPVIIAICCLFVFSSLIHLVPYQSKTLEEAMTRMDKSCILALCVTSFMTPQLLESEACKPDFQYSLVTVAIPGALAFIGILCGLGPITFASFIFPVASNLWFYGVHVEDSEVFYWVAGSAVLYALGFSLYASQAGGHHPFWGYHEWFHLLVTIAIGFNARGIFTLSSYTDEICSAAGSAVAEALMSSHADEIRIAGSTIAESVVRSGLFDDLSWLVIQ